MDQIQLCATLFFCSLQRESRLPFEMVHNGSTGLLLLDQLRPPPPLQSSGLTHHFHSSGQLASLRAQIPKLLLHPAPAVVNPRRLRPPLLLDLAMVLLADLVLANLVVVQPHGSDLLSLALLCHLFPHHLLHSPGVSALLGQPGVPFCPVVGELRLELPHALGVELGQLRCRQIPPVVSNVLRSDPEQLVHGELPVTAKCSHDVSHTDDIPVGVLPRNSKHPKPLLQLLRCQGTRPVGVQDFPRLLGVARASPEDGLPQPLHQRHRVKLGRDGGGLERALIFRLPGHDTGQEPSAQLPLHLLRLLRLLGDEGEADFRYGGSWSLQLLPIRLWQVADCAAEPAGLPLGNPGRSRRYRRAA
mmetsp:Transcript_34534/g.90070  ORF Transcript_34534/g.90070 Transcript_34534/m.90070 type:complete len:359 (-) Transcript_34534:429-1505(-)